MLVCVLSDIKFAVILSVCPGTDISAWPPKKQVFRKTVSCSITCQLELDISSTRAINNVRHVAVVPPRGVHYKQKYVAFLQHHL